MPIKVPNASEQTILRLALNNATPQDLKLKLFTNNISPGDTDVASTYTEAAGGGYSDKTLSGASWSFSTNASGEGLASYAAQTWTFTGALSGGATIYGYYVVQTSSGLLLFAERVSNSFTPGNSGDAVTITPQVSLGSKN